MSIYWQKSNSYIIIFVIVGASLRILVCLQLSVVGADDEDIESRFESQIAKVVGPTLRKKASMSSKKSSR